jgi:CubicO group peptidase (beta-lactamase class C family)
MFNPPQELKSECAATERGQSYELAAIVGVAEKHDGKAGADSLSLKLAQDQDDDPVSMTADFPLAPSEQATGIIMSRHPLRRTEVIRGDAHDGNAFFMGGAAGHAGLFSTAREVFRLACQFLPSSEIVSPRSLHLFTDNLTRGRGDERSVGWLLASTPGCSAGPRLPLTAFGHTGFTGTSLWIDPEKQRVFVLLTNRVHPKVGTIEMRGPRQRFNSLAVEALESEAEK